MENVPVYYITSAESMISGHLRYALNLHGENCVHNGQAVCRMTLMNIILIRAIRDQPSVDVADRVRRYNFTNVNEFVTLIKAVKPPTSCVSPVERFSRIHEVLLFGLTPMFFYPCFSF